MTTPVARSCLLALTAAVSASVGTGEPPKMPEPRPLPRENPWIGPPLPSAPAPHPAPESPQAGPIPLGPTPVPRDPLSSYRPYYTAFPDLKPPTIERKEVRHPDGSIGVIREEKGAVPLPPLPVVAADASPLRKVQFEQLQEGLNYIARIKMVQLFAGPGADFLTNVEMTAATFRVAVELEEDPAKRIPWLEARVRAFKEGEQFVEVRIRTGTIPPQQLNQIRFARLEAEANLLKLKAEIEKSKK